MGTPEEATQDMNAEERARKLSHKRTKSMGCPHDNEAGRINSIPPAEFEDSEFANVPFYGSHRFRLAVLCFFGMVNLYTQRVNLTIAIVSMSGDPPGTHNHSGDATGGDDDCPDLAHSDREVEFHWGKQVEGWVLGSFYWGYLTLQVPGGRIAELIGAVSVMEMGMLPVAICSLISAPVARLGGPYAFMALRILIGIGESVVYPAIQALWAKWAPPQERSRLVGFSYAGGQFGNAIIFPIGGFLSAYGFDGGWPSVFYVTGAAGFIWCVVWWIVARDRPDLDKTISPLEEKYIFVSRGGKNIVDPPSIPWKKMLTSKPCIALCTIHCCGNYGYYMLLTKIPAYMKEVLKFDIKSNGMVSMLPYLAFWSCMTMSAIVSDVLIKKNIFSVGGARKVMSTIGTVMPAILLVITGHLDCSHSSLAVAVLTLSGGFCGFAFAGYFINHGDIAPPFAGTLFGITNTFATIPGLVSPVVVSYLTPHGTQEEWQIAFYVAAVIYVIGAIVYLLFGEGKPQPWAQIRKPSDTVAEEKQILYEDQGEKKSQEENIQTESQSTAGGESRVEDAES